MHISNQLRDSILSLAHDVSSKIKEANVGFEYFRDECAAVIEADTTKRDFTQEKEFFDKYGNNLTGIFMAAQLLEHFPDAVNMSKCIEGMLSWDGTSNKPVGGESRRQAMERTFQVIQRFAGEISSSSPEKAADVNESLGRIRGLLDAMPAFVERARTINTALPTPPSTGFEGR